MGKRPKTLSGGWFRVLLAARQLDANGFTSADLVEAAGLMDGTGSSARDQAGAWLCKFVHWGYAKRRSKRRPVVYALTKYGQERGAPEAKR